MIKKKIWEDIADKWGNEQKRSIDGKVFDGKGLKGESGGERDPEWDSDLDDILDDIIKNKK